MTTANVKTITDCREAADFVDELLGDMPKAVFDHDELEVAPVAKTLRCARTRLELTKRGIMVDPCGGVFTIVRLDELRTVTIKVTDDRNTLWRVGGESYAEKHVGKTYEGAEVDEDGWARVHGDVMASFPPITYEKVEEGS